MPLAVSVACHGLSCKTIVLVIGSADCVETLTSLGAPGVHGPLAARAIGSANVATPTSLAEHFATCDAATCHEVGDEFPVQVSVIRSSAVSGTVHARVVLFCFGCCTVCVDLLSASGSQTGFAESSGGEVQAI
jgi:hypothetical protein